MWLRGRWGGRAGGATESHAYFGTSSARKNAALWRSRRTAETGPTQERWGRRGGSGPRGGRGSFQYGSGEVGSAVSPASGFEAASRLALSRLFRGNQLRPSNTARPMGFGFGPHARCSLGPSAARHDCSQMGCSSSWLARVGAGAFQPWRRAMCSSTWMSSRRFGSTWSQPNCTSGTSSQGRTAPGSLGSFETLCCAWATQGHFTCTTG